MEAIDLYQKLEILDDEAKQNGQQMNYNMMKAFLLVCIQDGVTQKDVVKRTGITDSAVTRIVQALAGGVRKEGAARTNGLGWVVERGVDETNWRTKAIFITDRGREVARNLGFTVPKTNGARKAIGA